MKSIFDLVIRFMAISAMLVGVSLAMVATAPKSMAAAADALVAEDSVVVTQAQLMILPKNSTKRFVISYDINELVDILHDSPGVIEVLGTSIRIHRHIRQYIA